MCALHYWQTSIKGHPLEGPRPALRPSDTHTLPIRPAVGYGHSTLVLWPLPHQEQPACTIASGRARENILSEFETTTKAAVEITEARGAGASFEEKSRPSSLFLWWCDHREQVLYLVLHGS